jgi:hypothetical protein
MLTQKLLDASGINYRLASFFYDRISDADQAMKGITRVTEKAEKPRVQRIHIPLPRSSTSPRLHATISTHRDLVPGYKRDSGQLHSESFIAIEEVAMSERLEEFGMKSSVVFGHALRDQRVVNPARGRIRRWIIRACSDWILAESR